MSLTFYFAPMSTASTVAWSLEELGIPYEGVEVDLKDPADKQRKLGPVNPNLKVPVIVHDGTPVFESAAIQIYLGETFGTERGLYPQPGPMRGEAMKWLVWASTELAATVVRWYGYVGADVPPSKRDEAAGRAARRDLDGLIGHIEQNLAEREAMLGATISLVDIHLASFFQWITALGVDLGSFPRTSAWLARCSARPASARAK